MLFQTVINITWEPRPNGQPISENVTVDHGGRYDKDFEIPAETSDHKLKLVSEESERQALIVVSDVPVNVRFGSQAFDVGPGNPIIWTEATRLPCTVRGDFQEVIVTNPSKLTAKLRIRIAERDIPAGIPAPVPAATPAPAPLVLAAPEPALAQ